MKKRYFYILPLVAVLVAACEPSISDEINGDTYYAGEADFTTYVAVGNSLTAGYMDGSMSRVGQSTSYPSILAKQFKIVGGGEFTQPSYEEDINDAGGLKLNGVNLPGFPTRMVMNVGKAVPGPENLNKEITIDITPGNLQQKAFNNSGVPGAKSFHLLAPGYGNIAGITQGTANPYFVRMATSPTVTVMEDAISLNPTFFTNWIGANDILAYAGSGGEGVDQNAAGGLNPSAYGPNDITHVGVFKSAYEAGINMLTAKGAKGVVATIPDVTTIPFFTTVPYNPIAPDLIKDNIDQLNMFVGMLKGILTTVGQGDRLQLFSATKANPLLIEDKTLSNMSQVLKAGLQQVGPQIGLTQDQINFIAVKYGQARHATAADLMLLTSKNQIGLPGPATGSPVVDAMLITGITYPITDSFVLNPVEQKNIKDATTQFNAIIRNVANEKGLAIADMNEIMNKAVSGIRLVDNQIYTANYFNGTNLNTVLFSLDGIHMNPRGYAYVANEIIKVINSTYKSNLPFVNISVYQGPTLVATN